MWNKKFSKYILGSINKIDGDIIRWLSEKELSKLILFKVFFPIGSFEFSNL